MKYVENYEDLFINKDYYKVQCGSADLFLGGGIAVQFNDYNHCKVRLIKWCNENDHEPKIGECFLLDDTITMISKQKVIDKGFYPYTELCLKTLKQLCIKNNITKLAFPKISCGIDRLDWNKVKKMILEIFEDTDMDIRFSYIN